MAINSSPKMGEGNTALILNPFLEGMREAGAKVELFYTKNLKINPCQGDYICWLKTPGKCIHKDDMEMLLPKLARADGRMSPETLKAVSRNLMSLEQHMQGANQFFQQMLNNANRE